MILLTKTSYKLGSCTIFKQTVSKYFSSNLISGYLVAVSRQHLKKRPSDIRLKTKKIHQNHQHFRFQLMTHIMFALCTAVTFFRLLSLANWNAKSATRRDASSVISLILCTTPSTISCSMPEYSPSVFSRIVTTSTPS